MKSLEEFLKDGEVKRARVAMAVASGELTGDAIRALCQEPEMKAAFIGTSYSGKCSEDRWDQGYLDELVCAAVAASFNEDYLLYLNEVAEAVRNKKRPSSMWFGIVIGVAAAAAVIVAIMIILPEKPTPQCTETPTSTEYLINSEIEQEKSGSSE